ncbi:DUF222 domain-containing protein [Klenkia terrae]|uniref:DUF222 domain-containing protein n=1 Tax=Klenkia terrae TaxID=1052259 RepID=UPI0036126E81
MQQQVVGTRMGLSVGIAQVEVFASAAAHAAVLEAEQATRIAAGLAPAGATLRSTRLSELLVTPDTGRARVHAVLRDVADAQAQLHALQAAAIARLAELQPAQEPLPGSRRNDPADADRPDDWVADEVAVVLGIGVSSAVSLVDKQRVLVEQLPQVWEALADGVIDVRRCQVLVDALAHRKQSAGGDLADDLVDDIARQGLRWIGEGIGPTPLADRIGGALIAADPAEADRRAERRKKKQNVTTVGCGDGLAGFRADLLDAADAAQMQAVVDAMAATMRKAGDRRPIGQLRVDAHRQLVLRPWEALPDDVARARWQLAMRVELADLDGLGSLGAPPGLPHRPPAAALRAVHTSIRRPSRAPTDAMTGRHRRAARAADPDEPATTGLRGLRGRASTTSSTNTSSASTSTSRMTGTGTGTGTASTSAALVPGSVRSVGCRCPRSRWPSCWPATTRSWPPVPVVGSGAGTCGSRSWMPPAACAPSSPPPTPAPPSAAAPDSDHHRPSTTTSPPPPRSGSSKPATDTAGSPAVPGQPSTSTSTTSSPATTTTPPPAARPA